MHADAITSSGALIQPCRSWSWTRRFGLRVSLRVMVRYQSRNGEPSWKGCVPVELMLALNEREEMPGQSRLLCAEHSGRNVVRASRKADCVGFIVVLVGVVPRT